MIEILVLALASTIRPTSLAAVSVILAHESRRRLLFAYVLGGLAFAVAVGVIVVGAFHGVHLRAGSTQTRAVANIAGGLAALVFGLAVVTGRTPHRNNDDVPWTGAGTAVRLRLDRIFTVPAAAAAGALTHLPGFFYLIALNLIVAQSPQWPAGLGAVVAYCVVWFALPLAALATCIANPDTAQNAVLAVHRWTGQHSRGLLLGTSFTIGAVLIVRGALAL